MTSTTLISPGPCHGSSSEQRAETKAGTDTHLAQLAPGEKVREPAGYRSRSESVESASQAPWHPAGV